MTTISEARSGKSARGENFPVASWLVGARQRPVIRAFYRFVRAADDVADNPTLSSDEKLTLLDRLEAALDGRVDEPDAEPLRRALGERGLSLRHALELLNASRLDATKRRYSDLAELVGYCRLSAMPVGRFVLDVHGESRALWAGSDALCAALQVINHLQDCGDDYQKLDRVYLPLRVLRAHGAKVEMLAGRRAAPALRDALRELADYAAALVEDGAALIPHIADLRLAAEIGAICAVARRLAQQLRRRDPLAERIALGRPEFLAVAATGVAQAMAGRLSPGDALRRRAAR